MRRAYYLIVIMFLVQSCASRPVRMRPFDCDEEFPGLFPVQDAYGELTITGMAKIEMPRYRLKGACRVRYGSGEGLRLDFQHSSLFGSYREDATIVVNGDEIFIIDHEHGCFYDNDSTLAILGGIMDFRVYAEDLLFALLLRHPDCHEFEQVTITEKDHEWVLDGLWRERHVEITGKTGKGPVTVRQCVDGGAACYMINYGYPARSGKVRYPSRIRITRSNGQGRISFEVIDIVTAGGRSGLPRDRVTAGGDGGN